MIKTKLELQANLDALCATLHQLTLDDAEPPFVWEAFELFTDMPVDAFVNEADRFWWSAQVYAIAEQYGLASKFQLRMSDDR